MRSAVRLSLFALAWACSVALAARQPSWRTVPARQWDKENPAGQINERNFREITSGISGQDAVSLSLANRNQIQRLLHAAAFLLDLFL